MPWGIGLCCRQLLRDAGHCPHFTSRIDSLFHCLLVMGTESSRAELSMAAESVAQQPRNTLENWILLLQLPGAPIPGQFPPIPPLLLSEVLSAGGGLLLSAS